ncbi:TBC1 domain family member 7-like [Gigantopelta aegis]|uniref:TBC1 domain family member 7-like n=1 Tax=Gigantopelta aegis TaxID=1735272 RepID=UPI001B88D689|nr:TBC1 domain family member 7-like [Gigantopelta aegis]
MTEERNFRTCYYEKFGFLGVEEKKSIEILLKEQPLDVEKLRIFCLRFPVPAMYRLYLWKILLGILPANQPSHDFVMKQRTQQFDDCHRGLMLMRRISKQTPLEEVLLKMHLLEKGILPFEDKDLQTDPSYRSFLAMAHGVCSIVDGDVDRYWITSRFYRQFWKYRDTFLHLQAKTLQCLKKEDSDQKLYNHLQQHNVISCLPLIDWFSCCFTGVLPDTSFERIWDKVIGGSCVFLAFVAVAIFLTFRRPLLSMHSSEEMLAYLKNIPDDCGDRLVSEAIDLWQKHGGHLVQTKSDSPNFDKLPT